MQNKKQNKLYQATHQTQFMLIWRATLECLPPAPGDPLVQGPLNLQRGFANEFTNLRHTHMQIQPLSTAAAA
jgi:hypothetical protein